MADRDRIAQPIRVVGIYVAVSLVWILFSDAAVYVLTSDPQRAQFINTIKGWIYVVAVAVLLYALLEADRRRFERIASERLEAEQRTTRMLERVPLAVLMIDATGDVLYANRVAGTLMGVTAEKLHGRTIESSRWRFEDGVGTPVPPEQISTRLTTRAGRPIRGDILSFERAGGERIWVSVNAEPIADDAGSGSSFLVTLTDITERVKASRRLERLNSLYAVLGEVSRLIVDLPHDSNVLDDVCRVVTAVGGFRMCWVGLVDEESGVVRPVASAGVVDGYLDSVAVSARDEPSGRGPTGVAIRTGGRVVVNDLSHDPTFALWRDEAVRRGYCGSAAFPLRREGQVVGALNVYAGTAGIFGDEELALLEKLADYVSFSLDYDLARQRREEAQKALRQWSDIFENTKVGVVVSRGGSGLIDLCNPACAEMHGYTTQELTGKPITMLSLGPETMPSFDPASRPVPHVQLESDNVRKDGTVLPVAIDLTVVEDDAGAPLYTIGTIIDITERRRAAHELERHRAHLEETVQARTAELSELNEKLVQATIAKSQFLANMSHELRTPLNSIIGFSGVLLQGLAGPLAPEQAKQVEMVNRSGSHLLRLINDVLDLSRIEAGRVRVDLESFDSTEVVCSVTASMRPLAEEKGLSLTLDAPDEAVVVWSDRSKLQQILINLLGNAIKFTQSGSIGVRMDATDPAWIVVAVADTGVGIDEDEQELIFEEFHQIAPESAGKPDGTGLGLAISQRLAGLLGGSIAVSSRVGHGSEFIMRIPSDPAGSVRTDEVEHEPPADG